MPGGVFRHGRIFGSPTGEPRYRYYAEFEFPDRDAWKEGQAGLTASAEDAQQFGIPFRVYFTDIA